MPPLPFRLPTCLRPRALTALPLAVPALACAAALAFALAAGSPAQARSWPPLGCSSGAAPSKFARAALEEVNLARTRPAHYAEIVARQFASLKNGVYQEDGRYIKMREGQSAVNEAIRALRRQAPLPPLALSPCLSDAAAEQVAWQGPSGRTGHRGRGGSSPLDRVMARVAARSLSCGENIAYGPGSPRAVVVQLLVDDGVADRGHRKALLNPDFRSFGTARGSHAKYRNIAVQEFCANPAR